MSSNDLDKEEPIVYVNGKRHTLPAGKGEWTLLQYLREIGLKGTKLGCGEGGCGACTVMVSNFDTKAGQIKNRSVNACLSPLYSVEGCHVVTVEGIGNSRNGLHPVQEKLAKSHGSQCGFCTPGFVMSMYSLLRSSAKQPTEEEIEENLAGNLCRCTGYRPILEAFRTFARSDAEGYTRDATKTSWEQSTSPSGEGATNGGSPICPGTGQPCTNGCGSTAPSVAKEVSPACEKHDCGEEHSWTGVAEPIFPPELRRRVPQSLQLPGPVCTWLRPVTLQELLLSKQNTPSAKLIVGNTEVGIEVKFKHMRYPVLVAPTHVPELNALEVREKDILLGASVTLTQMRDLFRELIDSRPAYQTCGLAAVVEQLRWFAGNQIRNVSSLAGNIVTGSPISDLNPLWMAMGATFIVQELGSEPRHVPATDFFLGYRKVDLRPAEVLVQILVPFMRELEYVREFKQAHRREDDIAIVNAGMRVKFELSESSKLVAAEVAIAYGGMAAKTVMAKEVAAAMQGKEWDTSALQLGLQALPKDVPLAPDVPGGMAEFRSSLAASFLYKFFVHASLKLPADAPAAAILVPQVAMEEHSAAAAYSRRFIPASQAASHTYTTKPTRKTTPLLPEPHWAT
ncbi:xylitol dehydrogenase [Cymbomonas tetramitiformis]|uniref:Xylitol dehydrogenase n=1 Tax=Cymbomonas tetramitiformis TaxID=36881 RepID=A0AAE0GUP6_9CHLO|nr:xylitol dehydrogenase [Cymbomonas tetramitiformis]